MFVIAYGYPIVPLLFVWKISFPHWILLASLLKISWPCENRLYSGLVIYVPILILIPHWLDNNGFVIGIEPSSVNPPTLFFSFKTAFSPTPSYSHSQNCLLATIVLNVYIMTWPAEWEIYIKSYQLVGDYSSRQLDELSKGGHSIITN